MQVGLRAPREVLDVRIADRVHAMLALGLVDEVETLVGRGLRDGRTASRALGYAQVLEHLDGRTTLDRARTDTVRATRVLARRQEKWFRRDTRISWLDARLPLDVRSERALAAVTTGACQGGP